MNIITDFILVGITSRDELENRLSSLIFTCIKSGPHKYYGYLKLEITHKIKRTKSYEI